jgi:hypothetical protein
MKPFAIGAVITAILFLAYSLAHGGDSQTKEMSFYDGNYEIVLTTQACPLEEHHGFEWYNYVLDKSGVIAEGCWRAEGPYVDIWVPQKKIHFQMYKSDFKPRTQV